MLLPYSPEVRRIPRSFFSSLNHGLFSESYVLHPFIHSVDSYLLSICYESGIVLATEDEQDAILTLM